MGKTAAAAGATDRGKVRPENEDGYLVDAEQHVYAVADGLGGLPEGGLASSVALDTLKRELANEHATINLDSLFKTVNQAVCEEGQGIDNELGIGTTLTLMAVEGQTMRIAHVGDTGIYRFREGKAEKLTTDHTMAQEMLERLPEDERERAYIPEYYHHTLTRCIGRPGTVKVDLLEVDYEPGDRILLYSDGVTKTLEPHELGSLITGSDDAESCVRAIIGTANDRGGPDNITAVAVFL